MLGTSLKDKSVWRFFNKGNANLLLEYHGNDPELKGKLLRLRLSNQQYSTSEVYTYINDHVRPVLPTVIDMEIIKVDFSVEFCLNDGAGLLVPNQLPMELKLLKSERYYKVYQSQCKTVLELKPKWIWNSHSLCRNCAHHQLKHLEQPTFCSSSLLKDDSIESSVSLISDDAKVRTALSKYFRSENNCLRKLRELQMIRIPIHKLTEESEVTEELQLAMTLRDVTIFFTVEETDVTHVTITDVDPKATGKWEHWASTEKMLIDNGYYDNVHEI